MITSVCQRWQRGRASYRPRGEPIATERYEVAPIPTDRVAKAFVVAHHYSGSYPAARRRFGLYEGAALAGVAVFSQPCHPGVFRGLPGTAADSLELGRFVLLDEVPANGESWFLARCFELLRREGFTGVASFSDPVPRSTVAGDVVHPGHVGTIYQASNAVYVGRGRPATLLVLADGTTLNARSLAKLRNGERGRGHVEARLVAAGAAPRGDEPEAEWAERWVPRVTRRLRHPGNHKYLWALDRRRKALPAGQPYPKTTGGLFAKYLTRHAQEGHTVATLNKEQHT